MLILSRKKLEACRITDEAGNEIEIHILGINKGRVKLGFEGPKYLRVSRVERVAEGEEMQPRPCEQ